MRNTAHVRGVYEKVRGSDRWWVRYVDAEGRFRRELAGPKSDAINLYRRRKAEALQGKKLPEKLRKAPVLFKEIVQDALAYSEKHKRSHRSDESIAKNLTEFFGNRPADGLFADEIAATLESQGEHREWSASTFNHHRSFIMLAYRQGRLKRKVTSNPARDVRHEREDNSRVRYLDREKDGEFERLYAVIAAKYPEHLAEFVFALGTGVRLGSQYSATYSMINWTRCELNLALSKGGRKSGKGITVKRVTIPLNEDVIAAVRSLPSFRDGATGPIFTNLRHPDRQVLSNDHWWKPAMKAAGVDGFHWHDLRHTFASWLVQDGVPLERVSKLLGHDSLQMTQRYAHLAPSQLHADVGRLRIKSPSGDISSINSFNSSIHPVVVSGKNGPTGTSTDTKFRQAGA